MEKRLVFFSHFLLQLRKLLTWEIRLLFVLQDLEGRQKDSVEREHVRAHNGLQD